MGNRRISAIWKLCLAVLLIGASVVPSATAQATEGQPPLMAPLSGSGPQSEVNLALGRPVTHSSQYSGGQSAWAVDGDENTSWIQLSADISDGEVWLTVDLGAATELDKAVIRWNTTKVQQYKIQHSADKLTWSDAYTSSGTVGNPEIARFPAVTDRYVRLLITGSGAVQEFELYLAGEEEKPEQPGPEVNLALGRPVTHSSQYSGGQSAWAVDGDENTSWIQLSADISDGEVWLIVDLGSSLQVNKYRVKWAASGVRQYKIQYSSDGTNWLDGYYRRGMVESDQSIVFNAVTGRYIRLQVDGSGAVAEFELYYAPEEPLSPTIDHWLREIEFVDADSNVWPTDAAKAIELGDNVQIGLRGYTYAGQLADLSVAQITYASLRPEIVSVSTAGLATGVAGGVVRVEAEVELAGIQVTGGVYIQVLDREALVADLDLIHPTASFAIGQPARIGAGQSYPSVVVTPGISLTVTGELQRDGSAVYQIPSQQLSAGVPQTITLPGTVFPGRYELRLELEDADARIRQDAFYFTVARSGWSQDDIDQLVFADGDELVSLPDHKGNRIMDFSDSGYGGGGVRIPDVPIRLTLQPALTGDDTDRIQQAIDEVSALPLDRGGFRGTVLLEAGQYRVAGSLTIAASGVVLRGEGDGAGGTEIIATGAAVRPLIQLSGQAGPLLETSAAVEISDLYVPAGSRSFHVHDAGQLAVGDKVMIRRVGNDHWLHEIRMDRITPRPDAPPGTTNSWVPFDLEFDRVITAIDDQIVTVDAPIASPIEWRWGGGQIIPYTDVGRISHVGVENLKLTSEFDDTVTAVHRGQTYYADEAHASDAITLDRVVHAWVRNIEARHFYSGLAIVGRETKWITIQDSKALDMVSVITGGRRSPISLSGTLALVQRIYTETARHAFAVQSRVPGPNVFLDGVSIDEYGASEPHHRWSVGGLYDNVSGTIAIQDRAWLGSGQGWSGANYVAWNTTGELILQQAPTSQNYSIGHTGTFGIPVVPSSHDPYPRPDGYIARTGEHVEPGSLYRTQLSARLGPQAVAAIAAHPIETVYAPSWLAGELTAVPATNGQVTLNWSGTHDSVSVATYALYMDGEWVDDTSGTSYTVSGLTPGGTYTFKVEAGNAAGWWSTDGPEEVVEMPMPANGGM